MLRERGELHLVVVGLLLQDDDLHGSGVQMLLVGLCRKGEPTPPGLLGLDEAHSALARLLLSRPEWTKDELGDAAADLDLMLDGAIETLNEAAFDLHGAPFTEGEDVVTVNPELLEKLEA